MANLGFFASQPTLRVWGSHERPPVGKNSTLIVHLFRFKFCSMALTVLSPPRALSRRESRKGKQFMDSHGPMIYLTIYGIMLNKSRVSFLLIKDGGLIFLQTSSLGADKAKNMHILIIQCRYISSGNIFYFLLGNSWISCKLFLNGNYKLKILYCFMKWKYENVKWYNTGVFKLAAIYFSPISLDINFCYKFDFKQSVEAQVLNLEGLLR